MLTSRVVCCFHQSDRRIRLSMSHRSDRHVSRTNRIAALGYVSRTDHITAFRCLAPITAFGYCFLINYVIESGGRAQRMKLNRTFGPI